MTDHTCSPSTCPEPGSYYITTVDGDTFWYMSDPYSSHPAALADVDRARDIACKYDRSGRAWFYGWGTARFADTENRPGNLQRAGLLTIGEAKR